MAEMQLTLPDYDPYNPFHVSEDQALEKYLAEESSFMPEDCIVTDILELYRRVALLVILKYSKCEDFDPLIPYLALTYFDRVILEHKPRVTPNVEAIPNLLGGVLTNNLELLALCCLTIAWKMRDRNFTIGKFRAKQPRISAITRKQFLTMELHILKKLNYCTRVVTPLCFLRYLVPKLDPTFVFHSKTNISEIIIQSEEELYLRRFKPSVIAASALLTSLNPHSIMRYDQAVRCTCAMSLVCKSLELFTESGVKQNEYLPMSEQVLDETTEQSNAEESMQTSERSTSKESELVATEVQASNDSTSLKRQVNKGKKKMLEATTEDTLLDFPLRWRIGTGVVSERYVIFRFLQREPNQVIPDQGQGDHHEPDQVIPDQGQGDAEPAE